MDFKYLLCVLGMVLIIEGLPYFAFAPKMKNMMRQVMEQPESTLRGLGLVATVIGLLLIYLGRS